MATKITDKDAKELNTGIVLLDVYADWCGPCRLLSPIIEDIAKEAKGYKVFKLDADTSKETVAWFEVSSLPTLIFLKDGEVVDRHIGYAPKSFIEGKIRALMK